MAEQFILDVYAVIDDQRTYRRPAWEFPISREPPDTGFAPASRYLVAHPHALGATRRVVVGPDQWDGHAGRLVGREYWAHDAGLARNP